MDDRMEVDTRPPLVGRGTEMAAMSRVIAGARTGRGRLVILRGNTGIGKTRLLQESAGAAKRSGFKVGRGQALFDSGSLYHAWAEALRPLGLEHLLQEDPPPRLLALYLISPKGLAPVRAERPGFSQDSALSAMMLNNAAEFLRDAVPASEAAVEGDLMRFADRGRGIAVQRGPGFAVLAVFEGRESELFLNDLARLAYEAAGRGATALHDWDGNMGAGFEPVEDLLRSMLGSGKYDGTDMAADGQARRLNLFDNVVLGIRRRAAEEPVQIVIDDLQWADASELGLLHYVARNTRADPVLITAAFRKEDAAAVRQLQDVLSRIARDDLADDVTVPPLSPEETVELAKRFLGAGDLPREVVAVVRDQTDGNPLFVRETLRRLVDEGYLSNAPEGGGWKLSRPIGRLEVATRIRDIMAARLSRLAADDRELLDAAAVLGVSFTGDYLAKLLGSPKAQVMRQLNALSRLHLFVRPEGKGWRFEDTVLQQLLYEELSEDLRDEYHRQAAEVARLEGAPPAVQGGHRAKARDSAAVPLLREGAEEFVRRGALDEAMRMLEKALEVAPAGDRGAILARLSEVAEQDGRYGDALSFAQQAQEAHAPVPVVALLSASALLKLGWPEKALAAVEEALPTAAGTPEETRLKVARVKAMYAMGRYEQGARAGREAADAAGPDDGVGRAEALAEVGKCMLRLTRYGESRAAGQEALDLFAAAGDRRGAASASTMLGLLYSKAGETEQCIRSYRQSLELAESIGDRWAVARAHNNIGNAAMERRELDEAQSNFERAREIAEAIGVRTLSVPLTGNLAEIALLRGDVGRSMELCAQAVTEARRNEEPLWRAGALFHAAEAHIAAGKLKEARALAEEAGALVVDGGFADYEMWRYRVLARLRTAEGDWRGARVHLQECVDRAEEAGSALDAVEAHWEWATDARTAGERQEARLHLALCEALFEELGFAARAKEAKRLRLSLRAGRAGP